MGRDAAEEFFEGLVREEMGRLDFRHYLIQSYLVGLLCSFVRTRGKGVFHVRRDPALAFTLAEADVAELAKLGDRLLFGLGIFPEHFVATGKRRVSLDYYLRMLETVVAKRLAQELLVWDHIHANFEPTLRSLHRVRSRVKFRTADIRTVLTVFEKTGELLG